MYCFIKSFFYFYEGTSLAARLVRSRTSMEKRKVTFSFWIDNPNLYRIAWREKRTGKYGGCLYNLTLEESEITLSQMNVLHPDFEHWIEPNPRVN